MSVRGPTGAFPFLWTEEPPGRTRSAPLQFDRGVLYGEGLFETLYLRGGFPFRLAAHLARLESSARALGLPVPAAGWQGRLAAALEEAHAWGGWMAARARVTLTAGDAAPDGDPGREPEAARLLLRVDGLAIPDGEVPPVRVAIAGPPAPGHAGALTTHKTIGWLGNLLCLREARRRGADEGLVAAADGRIVGAARANLFLVIDDALVTPSPACGPLPGITAGIVAREIIPVLGLRLVEQDVRPVDMACAQEAFLTNSIRGVQSVAQLPGWPALRPGPGPVAARVLATYADILLAGCGPTVC